MLTALEDMTPTIRLRVGGVYVRDQQLLLVRHEKDARSYWLLPGGGVEPGERMATALERELLEECGTATRTDRMLFVSEAISPARDRHFVNLTFLGHILEGEPVLQEHGGRIVEVAWVPRELLGGLAFYPGFLEQLIAAWNANFALPPAYLGDLWRD